MADVEHWQDADGSINSVTLAKPLPVQVVAGSAVLASKGYQQIVGLAAATLLTVPAGTTLALITTEGQSVRWRDDGVAPTGTVGQQLLIGQTLHYDSSSIAALEFIQTAATATLDVSYYG